MQALILLVWFASETKEAVGRAGSGWGGLPLNVELPEE